MLYASSQHVWRTTNGGQSWQRISPDLTRHDPATMQASGGPITKDQTGVETYATVFTIAPSRQDINTIWTGSDDGFVHVTRDGGKNWQKVNPPDMPDFTRISLIEASPHQNGAAYLAGNRYQRDDRKPYIYKTADFGKTWTKIVNGIPENDFPRAIREDPKRRGLLYVGTENGIYVSFDDGANWQSLRLNLSATPVHGVVVEDRDLVIGTHGRGFYVLDDIGLLREADPKILTSALHLFEPIDPQRGFDDNVAFDYYLGREAEEVKIEVTDAQGKVLRSFTGTPKDPPPPPPGGGGGGPFGQGPPPRVGRQERHEPVHVGSAAGRRRRLRGHDHVGRSTAARSCVAAGTVQGPRHRARRDRDERLQHRPRQATAGEGDHRSGPARAVQALDYRPRQGQRGEQRGDSDPVDSRAGKRADGEGPGAPPQGDPGARRRPDEAADGRRRRGLPGQEPQQPGSAQLPDQTQQQDRGALGRDRDRPTTSRPIRATRCSRTCRVSWTPSCRR